MKEARCGGGADKRGRNRRRKARWSWVVMTAATSAVSGPETLDEADNALGIVHCA